MQCERIVQGHAFQGLIIVRPFFFVFQPDGFDGLLQEEWLLTALPGVALGIHVVLSDQLVVLPVELIILVLQYAQKIFGDVAPFGWAVRDSL